MKGSSLFLMFLKVLLLFVFVVIFGFYVWQMNNLELRFINMANKVEKFHDDLQELRRSIDKMYGALKSGQYSVSGTAGTVAGQEEPKRTWLHPEAPNYLEKEPYVITPDYANTDGVIVRWFGTDPKGLNFILENGADVTRNVENYVSESLATRWRTKPDKWRPVLAERVEITDDSKLYTVYLRKDVKWHSPAVDWSNPRYEWLKGEHYLTARDIDFSLKIILNPQVEAASLRNYYQDIESVKVLDDHTIQIRWQKKIFHSVSSTLGVPILPEFLYAYDEDGNPYLKETFGLKFNEHWYNRKAIGTGPYEFISWDPGVSMILKRNVNYWGDLPAIKEIVWLIYTDPIQNLLKLKSGEQDFGLLRPTQYREEILNGTLTSPFKDGRMEHSFYTRTVYYYIGWNADTFLFSDKRVRQAMTRAFNRRDILKNIFMNLGEIVTGNFFQLSPEYNRAIEPYEFDLDESRRLLAEAGWQDLDEDGVLEQTDENGEVHLFEFNFLIYGSSQEWKTAATVFKEDLRKVGVHMNIQTVEWATMQKKMEDKEFHAYTGGWALGWDSDPYQVWHSTQADIPKGSNRVGFRNKAADKIIEEARVTLDKQKRIELFHKFHQIVHEEQPYTFFYCPKGIAVWWKHVHRVEFKKTRPHEDSLPWYVSLPEKNKALGVE
ncbi:MAG: ABC transporter substrate-binding protein [bacterium]|jgi:ABC-type transport system substrate-binding protein|nr:ABC transporter substrate-binding protein [bacterium]